MSNLIDKIDKLLIEEDDMSKWKCPCGLVYDPKEHGGKPFSDLSGPCPESGTPKSKFKKLCD